MTGVILNSLQTILLTLVIWMLALTGFAQGLVIFGNGPYELLSYGPTGNESVLPANDAGGFYFALLISTNAAGPFSFTGLYDTNTASAGRIANYAVGVPGWPPDTLRYYEIAGWSSNLGPVWNPGWLVNNLPAPGDNPVWSGAPTNSYFGLSGIAQGYSGGGSPVPGPAWNLFGGTGLQGFDLPPIPQQVDLTATSLDNNIVISWTPPGGTLQSSLTVGPGATWSDVGTQNPTNLPITGGAEFFRVSGGPYSSNIVGFATVTLPPGYSLLANPLDAGATNGANEIMPILDGEIILTWNGVTLNGVMYDSTAGGWVTSDDATAAQPPSLPPGQGFFFFNPNPSPTNFTFVGQTVPGPSATNCLELPAGYTLIGSPLPAAVDTITNPPVQFPTIDGMSIIQWSGGKYVGTMFDSSAGGWVEMDDTTPSVAPPYSIGQGFFLFNPNGGVVEVWCQRLP